MTPNDNFPRLASENYQVTSPASTAYNCIAWAAGDSSNWWQPGDFWPVEPPAEVYGIESLEAAFRALGFNGCPDGSFEQGCEKIALYGDPLFYTHAARQLANGKWTSKLGKAEDIEHASPEDLAGGIYGSVVRYMKREVRD